MNALNAFKTNKEDFKQSDQDRFKFKKTDPIVQKPKPKEFVMDAGCFPELPTSTATHIASSITSNTNKKSFANLVATNNTPTIQTEKTEYIPPGYIMLKLDKKTKKITTMENNKKSDIDKDKNIVLDETTEIIRELTNLHIKRTEEYIDLWGLESYINTYVCPNYDYEYFDKLDEAYEIEMYEQEQADELNNYENY